MIIVNSIEAVRREVSQWRLEGKSIGFVPTMGFLHTGHEELIRKAGNENDRVVVSIFVNPLQFDSANDFTTYPKSLDLDLIKCKGNKVSLVFTPDQKELYPLGFSTYVNMTGPSDNMCGRTRDDHYKGVCTVVSKLFNIVSPHNAYFGKKDAQQVAVIKRMVMDLNFNINIVACDTVREADGLAMSSRNFNLNDEQRLAATILYKALSTGKNCYKNGEFNSELIIETVKSVVNKEKIIRLEYIKLVDSLSMKDQSIAGDDCIIALAALAGETRLIDNIELK